MSTLYFFEDYELPFKFDFPQSYLGLANGGLPEIKPWWWLSPHKKLSVDWIQILQSQFPSRSLVPFAKDGASDDVACFDGSQVGSEPRVFVIHTFCPPGWELRGEFESFNHWLHEMQSQILEPDENEGSEG
jgi:hypothetical protein